MEPATNCIDVAECASDPVDPTNDACQCGGTDEESKGEPILPGMSDANSQFNPYCEAGPKKTFKSVVKRHFVKDKLFNLVSDFLRSIEEEKQAQIDVIASFAQVREITAPIRKANNVKAKQPTVLKRRKSRSSVPLLERIVQTRLDNEKNKEHGANIDIVVTDPDSKIVGEIQINQPEATVQEETAKDTTSNNIHCDTNVVKTKPPEPVYLDEDLEENNNNKQTTNKHDNTLFRRRRSVSSLPGFLEKCSVMKFLKNVNNIREIDQLVLESMEENTSTANTPRNWRYRRTKKKKKHTRTEKEDSKDRGDPNKECQVVIEVESHSDSDSDSERPAIINVAERQQGRDKSNKIHPDTDNELQTRDKPDSDDDAEEDRFAMPPTRKLTVNISSLDTIAEVSHESFGTLHSSREPSPCVSKGRQNGKRDESDVEDQPTRMNNCRQVEGSKRGNVNDDKTQMSFWESSRKPSPTKLTGKHHSVHVSNSKRTRPRSKVQHGRTFTLDILDVYEENADLQTATSPVNSSRSKSAKPRLVGEKRTRVKSSKRRIAPMPSFDHLNAERNGRHDEEDDAFELHRPRSIVSPRVGSNSTNSLEDTETYFQVLKNSQKDKLYKKPDRVLWYDLDITEGCYKMCNGSNMKGSEQTNNMGTWNSPIKEAIKNIKGTKAVPEIREMTETVPRELRVGRLYKNLRKERSKSARGEYRMLKTPSLEENGYYID